LKRFHLSNTGAYYRQLSKERGWALDLRLSLSILFALTWLATQFGTSVLVAGFAAGTIFVLIAHPKRFVKQLTGVAEGFFVPLFFVVFGAKLDFTQLLHHPGLLVLTGSIVVASIVVHLIVAKAMSLPYASGLMAATQQGLPIALVNIGLANKSIEPGQGAAIIAGAMMLLGTAALGASRLAKLVPHQPNDTLPPQPPPSLPTDNP
jgi:Kef-type K+ transport system membrane component KefB